MKKQSLSKVISENTVCYNNEKNIIIEKFKNNELKISMPLHCATHIDFPSHKNGKKNINDYDINDFIFNKTYVREICSKGDYFSCDKLKNIPSDIDFLIIKTNNHLSGINLECAKYLRNNFKNLKAIGVDCLSLNAFNNKEEGRLAHEEFLNNEKEILIIEDMELKNVKEGLLYNVEAIPLMVENADGTPVNVIADKNYEAIFFDWDGVITDSVNVKTQAFYDMFFEYGIDVQEKVKAHHLQNGGMSRFEKFKLYYKEYLGIDINEQKIQELSEQFSNLVKKKVINAPFIDGAVETIKKEYEKGTKLFIVSGTPEEEIQEIAAEKGLKEYFIEICGSPAKKPEIVKKLLKQYNLKNSDCLFIGDAMSDYKTAQECELDFLGIKIPSCKTQFPKGTKVKERVEI